MPDERPRRDYGFAVTNLHALRRAKFLSARELADRAGVNYQTILRLEKGTYTAQAETVRKLAEALGVEPSALVGEQPGIRWEAAA